MARGVKGKAKICGPCEGEKGVDVSWEEDCPRTRSIFCTNPIFTGVSPPRVSSLRKRCKIHNIRMKVKKNPLLLHPVPASSASSAPHPRTPTPLPAGDRAAQRPPGRARRPPATARTATESRPGRRSRGRNRGRGIEVAAACLPSARPCRRAP